MKNTSPNHILKASKDELISVIKNHGDHNVEVIILAYGLLKMEDAQISTSFSKEAEILSKRYNVNSLDEELEYWMKEYWKVSSLEELKNKIEIGEFEYRAGKRLLRQFMFLKILAGSIGFIWFTSVLLELGRRGPTWHHIFGLMFLVLIYAVILVAKYLGLILKEFKKRS